jgi:hypothetical protein
MGIPWGTNLSTIAPAKLTANGDVTLTAGAWVTGIHSQSGGSAVPLIFDANFDVIPVIIGAVTVLLGGTAPTALELAYATTAGTPIDTYTVEPGLLVDSAELIIPFMFVGPQAILFWSGVGVDPLIQLKATTTAATLKHVGSQAYFQLQVGID